MVETKRTSMTASPATFSVSRPLIQFQVRARYVMLHIHDGLVSPGCAATLKALANFGQHFDA
jgi:hypothetical protein